MCQVHNLRLRHFSRYAQYRYSPLCICRGRCISSPRTKPGVGKRRHQGLGAAGHHQWYKHPSVQNAICRGGATTPSCQSMSARTVHTSVTTCKGRLLGWGCEEYVHSTFVMAFKPCLSMDSSEMDKGIPLCDPDPIQL